MGAADTMVPGICSGGCRVYDESCRQGTTGPLVKGLDE